MPSKSSAQVFTSQPVEGVLIPARQPSSYAKYRRMRNDPTLSLARRLFGAAILSIQWSIGANDKAPDGAKGFIDESVQRLRTKFVRAALTGMFDYGWQPYEKIMEVTSNGLWRFATLKPLLQDFSEILVDPQSGALAGLKQDIDKEVRYDTNQSMVLSFDYEGTDWYGTPLMVSSESAYDKALIVEDGATRYDRKIAGSHWIVHYPEGETTYNGNLTDNGEIASQLIRTLTASGAIAIPTKILNFIEAQNLNIDPTTEQWRVELLSDGGAGAVFSERLNYFDKLKVRGVGIPERSILEGQFGTKAEAEAHADFAILHIEQRALEITEQFNEQAVNHLLRVNYGVQYEDTVYVEPPALADTKLSFLKQVYTTTLANPDGFLQETDNVDFDALRDALSVPYKAQQVMPTLPNPADPTLVM